MRVSGLSSSLNGGGADDELADGCSVEDEGGPDLLSLLQNGIAVKEKNGLSGTQNAQSPT